MGIEGILTASLKYPNGEMPGMAEGTILGHEFSRSTVFVRSGLQDGARQRLHLSIN